MSDDAAGSLFILLAIAGVIGGVVALVSYRPTITLCVIGGGALTMYIWYQAKHPVKDWQQKLQHQRQARAVRSEVEQKYQDQVRRLQDRFEQG